MKKVLICLYYYEPYVSGLTIYASSLAKGLVKSGYEVTVLCSKHDEYLADEEIIDGVKVIREKVLASFGKGVIMPTFWLKALKLSFSHDIVNLHFPNADLGLTGFFIPRKKLYITYHCDINLGKGIVNQFIQKVSFLLMELAMFRANKIIGNSKSYFLNSHFKKYKNKFVGIYPPIDFDKIKAGDQEIELLKENHDYKIGFLGRIVFEKGINYLLKAIDSKYLKDVDFKLYLGGDYANVRGGSIKQELDKLVALNPDKIVFLGNIDKPYLKHFFENIDVLVLPSIDPLESFGMVQVESLFCNTPVIASNMPGVNEVVSKTGFGLLAKPKSSQDLSEQLVKMYQDLPRYKELRNTGELSKTALKTFSFDNTINDYINLFFNKI